MYFERLPCEDIFDLEDDLLDFEDNDGNIELSFLEDFEDDEE